MLQKTPAEQENGLQGDGDVARGGAPLRFDAAVTFPQLVRWI
jgi:hypothetical protein